jgi:hypothetical protein
VYAFGLAMWWLARKAAYSVIKYIPDEPYLKLQYRVMVGKRLDLARPTTFNEKLQWLKLHDRNPLYTRLADKFEVRDYIGKRVGTEYLIPLLGVYRRVEDIDFSALPHQFVLKCTHDSGGNVICNNKVMLDEVAAKRKLKRALERNYFWFGREWPYKGISPRVICEQYVTDESGDGLRDYKIFCFHGHPRLIQVDLGRFVNHKRNLYSPAWELLDFEIALPRDAEAQIPRPRRFDDMLRIAETLSAGFSHVRIDMYSVRDTVYVGEMTFHHGSGYEQFRPESYDELLGSWIRLPSDSLECPSVRN